MRAVAVGRPSLNQSSALAATAGVALAIARAMVRQIAAGWQFPKRTEGVEAGGDEVRDMGFLGDADCPALCTIGKRSGQAAVFWQV